MHASVDVHVELTIDPDKTLTLGTLAEAITDQDTEEQVVEQIVESVDTQRTKDYCGEKYERGNNGYEDHADLGASGTFPERARGGGHSQADCSARAPHVGRPRLVGDATLSREGESQ